MKERVKFISLLNSVCKYVIVLVQELICDSESGLAHRILVFILSVSN